VLLAVWTLPVLIFILGLSSFHVGVDTDRLRGAPVWKLRQSGEAGSRSKPPAWFAAPGHFRIFRFSQERA